MAKMLPGEMKVLLRAAIERRQQSIEIFKGNDNPQIVKSVIQCQAEIEAFDAVLLALTGDGVSLRIMAGK